MKNIQRSILAYGKCLLLVLFIAGCKATQEETVTDNQADGRQVYHIVVSFYSIGAGINTQARNALNNLLEEYTTQKNLPVHVEKRPWGREGEVDYCIDLKDLTQKDRQQFINKSKEYLASQDWVRIKENTVCREGSP